MAAIREDVLRRVRWLDATEAEDCLHDVMLRAVVGPSLDLDSRRLVPYLVRATVWRATDRRRTRDAAARASASLGIGRCATVVSPEELVADRGAAETLARAVGGLAPREREVIRHRAAGFDAGETARRLGISYKAQEGALTRARAKLSLFVAGLASLLVGLVRRAQSRASTGVSASLAFLFCAVPLALQPPTGESFSSPGGHHMDSVPSVSTSGPEVRVRAQQQGQVAGQPWQVVSRVPVGRREAPPAEARSPLVIRNPQGGPLSPSSPATPPHPHLPGVRRALACVVGQVSPTSSCSEGNRGPAP
jgi:RNA polymerase sigma-70 factor (ECF subfamily)